MRLTIWKGYYNYFSKHYTHARFSLLEERARELNSHIASSSVLLTQSVIFYEAFL